MRQVVNEQTRFLSTEFFGPYLSLLWVNICGQTVCGNIYIYIFLFARTFFCGSQEKSQEIEPAKNFVPQSSPKTQKKSSKEKKSGQHIRVSNVFPPSCLEILDIIHFNKPVGTFLFDPGSLFLTNTRMIWRSR